jgi:hypothetical protein
MALFRPARHRVGLDPHLPLKMFSFALGAGCAVAGMYFHVDWLITVGIMILAGGLILSLVGARRRRLEEDATYADDELDDAVEDDAEH